MNKTTTNILISSIILIVILGCKEITKQSYKQKIISKEEDSEKVIHLSGIKFNNLGFKVVDSLPKKMLSELVEANGHLEVPPQYKATVTAILGGNVSDIKIIEGDKVSERQVLAYLSHPDLIKIQTDYIRTYNKMGFLKKEFERQKRLYEEKVGSGKIFQQTQSDYLTIKSKAKGLESQLRQLNIRASKIRKGDIYEYIPVISPISGYIKKVNIQMGQYVESKTSMFVIVDNEHIHADLMIFEKDIYKIKKGQKISFTLDSFPKSHLTGEIYSVGKQFEKNPKAVHIHAKINKNKDFLIPGMYINGKIRLGEVFVKALPEKAIMREDDKFFIFTAKKHLENGKIEWELASLEIQTGIIEDGWVEIKLLKPIPRNTQILFNNAYYLYQEKEGGTLHSH